MELSFISGFLSNVLNDLQEHHWFSGFCFFYNWPARKSTKFFHAPEKIEKIECIQFLGNWIRIDFILDISVMANELQSSRHFQIPVVFVDNFCLDRKFLIAFR